MAILEIPEDSHIANITGNLNYTDAYKKMEANKNRY